MFSKRYSARAMVIPSLILVVMLACQSIAIPVPPTVPAATPTIKPSGNLAVMEAFVGSWHTQWGSTACDMVCKIEEDHLHCDYQFDDGMIDATVGGDGKTMEGTWTETPTRDPAKGDGGRIIFVMDERNPNHFTGSWWYGDSGRLGSLWEGTRK